MSEIGLQSIKSQEGERAPKPNLLPSPGLGAWLHELGGSLAFTTYQTARIFFLSGQADGQTIALERIVGSAMGLAVDQDKLWITNKEQAWRFANVGPRALKPGKGDEQPAVDYDAVFMPRWGVFLGPCDTHDVLANIHHRDRLYELLFVNTNFNCVASIDGHYNFVPVWKPSFIDDLFPGDACHLNGMGARDGQLAYATACATTQEPGSWREHKSGGGVLIDVRADEIIATGFAMPHSPRWHDGKIWMLDSGRGDFGYVEPGSGRFQPVCLCPGFARGLQIVGHHALIGLSRLRPNTFASGLPVKQRLEQLNIQEQCGLLVVNLQTGKPEHWLRIEGGITELYDVAFLPGMRRPYTPGFSEPERHRNLLNLPNLEGFPLRRAQSAAPAQAPS